MTSETSYLNYLTYLFLIFQSQLLKQKFCQKLESSDSSGYPVERATLGFLMLRNGKCLNQVPLLWNTRTNYHLLQSDTEQAIGRPMPTKLYVLPLKDDRLVVGGFY